MFFLFLFYLNSIFQSGDYGFKEFRLSTKYSLYTVKYSTIFFHPLFAPNSPLSICLILLLNPHSSAYSWKCILFGWNILLFCTVFVAQSHQLLCCWKFWYKQFRIRAGSSSRLMVTSFMWVLRVSFHVHICVLLFRQQQTLFWFWFIILTHWCIWWTSKHRWIKKKFHFHMNKNRVVENRDENIFIGSISVGLSVNNVFL